MHAPLAAAPPCPNRRTHRHQEHAARCLVRYVTILPSLQSEWTRGSSTHLVWATHRRSLSRQAGRAATHPTAVSGRPSSRRSKFSSTFMHRWTYRRVPESVSYLLPRLAAHYLTNAYRTYYVASSPYRRTTRTLTNTHPRLGVPGSRALYMSKHAGEYLLLKLISC